MTFFICVYCFALANSLRSQIWANDHAGRHCCGNGALGPTRDRRARDRQLCRRRDGRDADCRTAQSHQGIGPSASAHARRSRLSVAESGHEPLRDRAEEPPAGAAGAGNRSRAAGRRPDARTARRSWTDCRPLGDDAARRPRADQARQHRADRDRRAFRKRAAISRDRARQGHARLRAASVPGPRARAPARSFHRQDDHLGRTHPEDIARRRQTRLRVGTRGIDARPQCPCCADLRQPRRVYRRFGRRRLDSISPGQAETAGHRCIDPSLPADIAKARPCRSPGSHGQAAQGDRRAVRKRA